MIEAMKAFTDVVADVEGTVAAVLVNNEEGLSMANRLFKSNNSRSRWPSTRS